MDREWNNLTTNKWSQCKLTKNSNKIWKITCCLGLECLLFFWWSKTWRWYVESTQPRQSSARRAWKDKNNYQRLPVVKQDQKQGFSETKPFLYNLYRACCSNSSSLTMRPSLSETYQLKLKVVDTAKVISQKEVMSQRYDDAHHMLHRSWKRIRFCWCRTGMMMRKTAIRRQRKNTIVWMIMPTGERSKP